MRSLSIELLNEWIKLYNLFDLHVARLIFLTGQQLTASWINTYKPLKIVNEP